MRISNQTAQTKYLALAEVFLSAQELLPKWNWKCVAVTPDLLSENNKDRKVHIKWSVVVEHSKNGHVIEGSRIVLVNIQSA